MNANDYAVGQPVIAETPLGTFLGRVESINPTQSREGRPYVVDGEEALGLDVHGMPDTLWVPISMII